MKNIFSTDDSVKRQITDSISENLTDSDLESRSFKKITIFQMSSFCTEKISSIKFRELFKSWGYRHLPNKILENVQNCSEYDADLSIIFSECFTFYPEKFCTFYRTLFRKCLYPQLLNSSINFTKLIFSDDTKILL